MKAIDFSVKGQRVLVVGAARSGVAAALLLVRRGASVTLTDRKPTIADDLVLREAGVALELGGHRRASFEHADLVVMSPGVPLELPEVVRARAAGVPVIGEMELASRWLRGPIVAITGTKGKSTTTTLVGRMLEAAGRRVRVGGNIGVPLSAQVDDSTERHRARDRGQQLPAGGHRPLPSVDCGAPEPVGRSPRPAPHARRLRGGKGAGVQPTRRPTTGPW